MGQVRKELKTGTSNEGVILRGLRGGGTAVREKLPDGFTGLEGIDP